MGGAVALVERVDVAVYHATWAELLDALPCREDGTKVDALIVDAPYSERTHSVHHGGAAHEFADGHSRRAINYPAWTPEDVERFVSAWSPVVRGWIVSVTDDVLAPAWRESMERAGRCGFPPVPCIIRGSRVRLSGDGPSCVAVYASVGRRRTKAMATWGTLPGFYAGPREALDVVGGKPLWLMERLVEDYSRPGDLVCDPCCGAGTTLAAALRTGRRAVGGDQMREHAELAAARVSRPVQRPLFLTGGGA